MDFQNKFEEYVSANQLLNKADQVILAVSGGRDSMVMSELFFRTGYFITLAHCNFNLRGDESDLDEQLVRDYAKNHRLPIFVKSFDTQKFAEENKISIQMAARELRYAWFEELRLETEAKYIAIAQHANDQIETVLLNLTRGTGLKGLNGILPKRDRIIRPILSFSSSEIQEIANHWKISYRDDASNFDAKYSRNKVRLKIIPLLKEINPEFEQTFIQNIQNFSDAYNLLKDFVAPYKDELFITVNNSLIRIEESKLHVHLDNRPLLYELFNDFNFNKSVINDLCDSWQNGPGRIFESSTHQLLFDREYIWLREIIEKSTTQLLIEENDKSINFDDWKITLTVDDNKVIIPAENVAQIDFDKLIFPLTLRNWQHGDKFAPLGMNTLKKVSDYLVGLKINLFEKEDVLVLINGNGELIWVLNFRLDNRYKLTKNTRKVLTLVCEK